jgi:hypothetical protein
MDSATAPWIQQQHHGFSNNTMDSATTPWIQQQHHGFSDSTVDSAAAQWNAPSPGKGDIEYPFPVYFCGL